MGAIIRNHSGNLLEIGGMPDHVHLLIEFSNLDKFSYLVRDLQAFSSLWIHKNFPNLNDFAWQEGYGSFSTSYSALESIKKYIQNQKQHHATTPRSIAGLPAFHFTRGSPLSIASAIHPKTLFII